MSSSPAIQRTAPFLEEGFPLRLVEIRQQVWSDADRRVSLLTIALYPVVRSERTVPKERVANCS